jgi:hypothetical protein
MVTPFQEGNFFWVLTLHFTLATEDYKSHSTETHYFFTKDNARSYANQFLFDDDTCTGCSIHKELFKSVAEDIAYRQEAQRKLNEDLQFNQDIEDAFTLIEQNRLKEKMQESDKEELPF